MDIAQAPLAYTNVNVDTVMIHHTLVSLNRDPMNETHSWALLTYQEPVFLVTLL